MKNYPNTFKLSIEDYTRFVGINLRKCTTISLFSIFPLLLLLTTYLLEYEHLSLFKFSQLILPTVLAAEDRNVGGNTSLPLHDNVTASVDTKEIKGHIEKGNELISTGKFREAIGEFDSAVELDGNNVEAIIGKGR